MRLSNTRFHEGTPASDVILSRLHLRHIASTLASNSGMSATEGGGVRLKEA